MERFISGGGVRDRFQWLPFELVAAMKSGELVPIDPEGEEQVRLTEDENPCLYCNGKRNPNECGRGKVTCTVSSLGSGEIISQSRSCLRHYTKTSQTQELDAAIFFFSEVLAYEQTHGLKPTTTPPTPTPTTEPGHDQQVEAVPHFATPSELVQYYRGRGVHELHELARLVDEEFTRKARLTGEELGMLLPAKGKEAESPEGCRSQGKRLRSLYKKSQ